MAIPHIIFKQKAKDRLKGKNNDEKIKEIKKLITELPGYRTGPYGEIRKWLKTELENVKVRKSSVYKDWFAVKKQGDAQIAVVGAPNTGKSSLLKALTNVQTKVAPYAFTTLKPVPAICTINSADIQFIEVPGLIEGAHEGKGMGRKLLSIAKGADFVIVVFSLSDNLAELDKTLAELYAVGITNISIIAANKIDLPGAQENLARLRNKFKEHTIVPVSAEGGEGLENLKIEVWNLLNLIRVFPKTKDGIISERPLLLSKGSTIKDFAEKIHKEIIDDFRNASIWGPSSKFPGQEVGLNYELQDKDIVQLHT